MPVNVNITLSEENVERLMNLLRGMNIDSQVVAGPSNNNSATEQNNSGNMNDDVNDIDSDDEMVEYEVRNVIGHRIQNGIFQFKIVWKNGEVSWVNDSNCKCDNLISMYLAKHNIHTAFLFCRVSTKEQAGSTHFSLQAQEHEMRTMIDTSKYIRIKVYTISESAYKTSPPMLREIAENSNSGDILVVWRVDRLSRNIEHTMEIINLLHRKNVDLYSYNEKLLYKENKIAFLQALLDAQKEAFGMSQRVKSALNRKRERGDHIGTTPFGMEHEKMLNGDGDVIKVFLVKNEQEKQIINKILEMRHTMKPNSIAEFLNNKNTLKRGKKWNASMVSRVIKNHKMERN